MFLENSDFCFFLPVLIFCLQVVMFRFKVQMSQQ